MIFTYSWNISSEDEELENFDPTRLLKMQIFFGNYYLIFFAIACNWINISWLDEIPACHRILTSQRSRFPIYYVHLRNKWRENVGSKHRFRFTLWCIKWTWYNYDPCRERERKMGMSERISALRFIRFNFFLRHLLASHYVTVLKLNALKFRSMQFVLFRCSLHILSFC